MDKKRQYKVSQAARLAGLSEPQLRNYLDMGLVRPCDTTTGGFRLFDERCIERLRLIRACRDAELGLSEIAAFVRALESGTQQQCRTTERRLRASISSKQRSLKRCARALAAASFEGRPSIGGDMRKRDP